MCWMIYDYFTIKFGRKERVTEMSLEDDVQLEVRMDEGHVFEGG